MPRHASSVVKFEIGQVFFIGIVGYSKLLIEERKERGASSPRLCWRLHRSPGRSMSNSLGLQPAMEWRWVSRMPRRNW